MDLCLCVLVVEVFGWDELQVSWFLLGQFGIFIGKIDGGFNVFELCVVLCEYFDGLLMMSKVGVNCYCVCEGFGECGGWF